MSYMNLEQNMVLFNQFGQPVIIPVRALMPGTQAIPQQPIYPNGYSNQQPYQRWSQPNYEQPQPGVYGYGHSQRPVYTHVNDPIVTKEYQEEAKQNADKPNGKPFNVDKLKSMILPELFPALNNLLDISSAKYKKIKINSAIMPLPHGFGIDIEFIKENDTILELMFIVQYTDKDSSFVLTLGFEGKEIHSVTESLPITQVDILSSLKQLFSAVIKTDENDK